MKKQKLPIEYAKAACDTMMRKFSAENLPPKGNFHYHQGVFLSGMYKTYQLCNDERYYEYIKAWVDSVVEPDGSIPSLHEEWLDDIQPGILLFPLYERTGDERYKKALDHLANLVMKMPKNQDGGLWHKDILPNQMWLDGLYMGGPICAEYANRFQEPEYLDLVAEQIHLMEMHTRDEKSGLWYHAWDEARKQPWANPETGLSAEFWGRSIGWVPVAMLDDLDFMSPSDVHFDSICNSVVRLLNTVMEYQSDEGRWYQVVNKMDRPENWLENSCSCLFVAAICKAVRKGLLSKDVLAAAKKGYEAVIASLEWDQENLLIGHVCIGTDVGDYKHYCNRPVSVNDLHGVGAFLLMCEEVAQVCIEQNIQDHNL